MSRETACKNTTGINMNNRQNLETTIRIPVITDLVRPGDREVIKRAKAGKNAEYQQQFERRLKARIAELQSATGQDEYSGLARAHAIRSEQQDTESTGNVLSLNQSYEQEMDARRQELLRELSAMLK